MSSFRNIEFGLRRAIAVTICIVALLFVALNASTFYFIIFMQSQRSASTSARAVSELVRDSKGLLENLAIQLLTEKAKDISNQIAQLNRSSKRAISPSESRFTAIAVQ